MNARGSAAVSAVAVALAAVVVALVSGCLADDTCQSSRDCNVGFDCSIESRCVPNGAGTVRWLSPAPGELVDGVFDAVLEVGFRGAAAKLHVDRAAQHGGDACAPFVPHDVVVQGTGIQGDVLSQQITVPGLRALGEDFTLVATLLAGREQSVTQELHGPPSAFGGVTVTSPTETVVDATKALVVPFDARFDRVANRAQAWVEILGTGDTTPKTLFGSGIAGVTNLPMPLVRGPQIAWLDVDSVLCGTAIDGKTDDVAGLELGLVFAGQEAGQLAMHVELDRPTPIVCTFLSPGRSCEALYETRAPATFGQEAIRVAVTDGDVVKLAVVPGASGAPLSATVRVSFNGVHVGYFGPFSVNPAAGEVWLPGTVTVSGALAALHGPDAVTIGAPF